MAIWRGNPGAVWVIDDVEFRIVGDVQTMGHDLYARVWPTDGEWFDVRFGVPVSSVVRLADGTAFVFSGAIMRGAACEDSPGCGFATILFSTDGTVVRTDPVSPKVDLESGDWS